MLPVQTLCRLETEGETKGKKREVMRKGMWTSQCTQGLYFQGYKKLAPILVLASIGHADNPCAVMQHSKVLVLELSPQVSPTCSTVDALPPRAISLGDVSSLNNKSRHNSVEFVTLEVQWQSRGRPLALNAIMVNEPMNLNRAGTYRKAHLLTRAEATKVLRSAWYHMSEQFNVHATKNFMPSLQL